MDYYANQIGNISVTAVRELFTTTRIIHSKHNLKQTKSFLVLHLQ